MTLTPEGGAAIPVSVTTTRKVQGGSAIPVYGYMTAPTDGRPAMGGAAIPVRVLTAADLKQNGGQWTLEGRPHAMPVYTAPATTTVMGGPAIAVYPVNAWPVVPVTPSTLLNGLVAYWKLEEASGTRVDATLRGNDLADVNGVTQVVGKVSYGAGFNAASTQRLQIASTADLTMAGTSCTIDGWFYSTTGPGYQYILSKATAVLLEYAFYLGPGTPRSANFVFVNPGGTPRQITGAANISLNTWYYFRIGYDATLQQAFMAIDNGVPLTLNDANGIRTGSGDFYVADSKADPGSSMTGREDEIGVWKRVLTAAEITSRFNGGSGNTHPFDVSGAPQITFLPVGDSKSEAGQWPNNLVAYDVVNQPKFYVTSSTLAVGGQSILGGGGTPSLRNTIDASLAAMTFTPSYILWNLGVNDAHPDNGYPPNEADWKAGVLYCWDALRTKWPSVPIKMMYVWRAAYPANCGVLDGWYADILPSRPFVSVIADERVWLENGDNGATYTVDGTHYSAAGNQKAADLWTAAMG